MELDKNYPVPVLRTLTKFLQLHQQTNRVSRELLQRALCDIQSEFTSNIAVDTLLADGAIEEKAEFLHPREGVREFDWLLFLLNREPSAMALGFPGSHTMVMMEELEKKRLRYIDHDAAWRSLMINSAKSLDIISPFIDPDGIDIFASDLIQALRKNIAVRIITRSYDSGIASQKRTAIERLIRRVDSEHHSSNLSFGYFHDGSMEEKAKHLGSVHAKLLIQDRRSAYVGSGEFRKNSAFMNLEVGFVSTIPSEINGLVTVFDVFWDLCDVRKME